MTPKKHAATPFETRYIRVLSMESRNLFNLDLVRSALSVRVLVVNAYRGPPRDLVVAPAFLRASLYIVASAHR